jgi:hypothetical protein
MITLITVIFGLGFLYSLTREQAEYGFFSFLTALVLVCTLVVGAIDASEERNLRAECERAQNLREESKYMRLSTGVYSTPADNCSGSLRASPSIWYVDERPDGSVYYERGR